MTRQFGEIFNAESTKIAINSKANGASRASNVGLPLRQALYHQVFKLIRDRIVDGELAPGTCLPNEFELANEFQVSIGTIRKAVDLLVDGRLLVRQQGKGTFVSAERWASMDRICDLFRDREGRPYTDWRVDELSYRTVVPPADVVNEMGLSAGSEAHRVVRSYSAAGGASVYEINWLSFQFFPSALSEADRNDRSALMRRYGVLVESTKRKVRVEAAPLEVARTLGMKEKASVLSITRTLVAEDGRTIEMAHAYCMLGAGWADLG